MMHLQKYQQICRISWYQTHANNRKQRYDARDIRCELLMTWWQRTLFKNLLSGQINKATDSELRSIIRMSTINEKCLLICKLYIWENPLFLNLYYRLEGPLKCQCVWDCDNQYKKDGSKRATTERNRRLTFCMSNMLYCTLVKFS